MILFINRYDISPYARHTIWTQFIGSIFSLLTLLCSQSILQRFLAMKTTREAQWLVLYNMSVFVCVCNSIICIYINIQS